MIGDSLDLGWTSCFGMETSVETKIKDLVGLESG
jgi:hypothetical protein